MKPKITNINEVVRQTSSCSTHTKFGFENYVAETLIRLGTNRLQATQEEYEDGTIVLKYSWPGTKIQPTGLDVFRKEEK